MSGEFPYGWVCIGGPAAEVGLFESRKKSRKAGIKGGYACLPLNRLRTVSYLVFSSIICFSQSGGFLRLKILDLSSLLISQIA
jgi:hypothetical protein